MDNYTALYELVVSLIPAGGRVIELGCGTGEFASMIIPKCDEYIGYDIDEESISAAVARNTNNEGTFVIQDIMEPSTYEPFGNYVALEVLEHLPDDGDIQVLQNIRKGSRVIISVPSFDSSDHKRFFPCEHHSLFRYEDDLDIDYWRKVRLPTSNGYFHVIRGYA